MVSRRNGELKRSVLSALAAMVAVAVPSLVSLPAHAETSSGSTPSGDSAKHEKHVSKKAHAVKGQKPHASKDATAQKPEAPRKAEEAHADAKGKAVASNAASPKGKKVKKTASRAAKGATKKSAKKADGDAPARPCYGSTLRIDRGGLEGESFSLVDCHGKPLDAARTELSVLARPWSVSRPARPAGDVKIAKATPKRPLPPGEISPGVKLVDPGLMKRLDAIAHRFPNRPISLVSGYRPQSRGSQHQAGRALDLRVAGVSNEDLVAFCKTLPDTGCGYYPNSSFVHVDVRNPGTGVVTWIDASGPGETPHYVKQWPPPPEEAEPRSPDRDRAEPHDATSDPWQRDPDPDPSNADDEPDTDAPAADAPADDKPVSPAKNPALTRQR